MDDAAGSVPFDVRKRRDLRQPCCKVHRLKAQIRHAAIEVISGCHARRRWRVCHPTRAHAPLQGFEARTVLSLSYTTQARPGNLAVAPMFGFLCPSIGKCAQCAMGGRASFGFFLLFLWLVVVLVVWWLLFFVFVLW